MIHHTRLLYQRFPHTFQPPVFSQTREGVVYGLSAYSRSRVHATKARGEVGRAHNLLLSTGNVIPWVSAFPGPAIHSPLPKCSASLRSGDLRKACSEPKFWLPAMRRHAEESSSLFTADLRWSDNTRRCGKLRNLLIMLLFTNRGDLLGWNHLKGV